MLRGCVWSRNIKNGCSIYIYIYDISSLRVKLRQSIRFMRALGYGRTKLQHQPVSLSPSFLINSRTADDVHHYRNHPSPIPPLRCFFKNCHQSSTPWHKLSRQTPLTLPLNYFPYFRPIRSDSHQFSVPFSSIPSLNQFKHPRSSRIIGGNNNSSYCFECVSGENELAVGKVLRQEAALLNGGTQRIVL